MAAPGYGVFTNNNYLPDLMQQTTQPVMPHQIADSPTLDLPCTPQCSPGVRVHSSSMQPMTSPNYHENDQNDSVEQLSVESTGMVTVGVNTQQRVPLVQPPDILSMSNMQPDVVPYQGQDSAVFPCETSAIRQQNNELYMCQQETVNQLYSARPDACSPYSVIHKTENLSSLTNHICPTGNISYPGGFTFTVPTQASAMSAGLNITSPSRWIYTNTTPHCHAPGIGALWQHAVPSLMPWGDNSARQLQGIATFTGCLDQAFPALGLPNSEVQRNTDSINVGHQDTSVHTSDCVSRPKPSCSISPRRPKRHHSKDESLSYPENKIYLSEEKMMERMRELSLCHSTSGVESNTSMSLPHNTSNSANCNQQQHKSGWRTLKEIEERLEIEDSDDDSDSNAGPKLQLMSDLSKELMQPSNVLPKKIIDDIRSQQCTEIVLWKPPGDFVQNVVPKSAKKTSRQDHVVMSDSHGRDQNIAVSLPSQSSPHGVFIFTGTTGNTPSSQRDPADMDFDDSMQL